MEMTVMIWYSSGWRIRLRRTTKRNNYINVKMSEKGSRLLGKSSDPFSLTGYRARTACVDRIIQPYRVCAGGNSLPSEGVCGCGKDGGNRQLYFLPSGAAF